MICGKRWKTNIEVKVKMFHIHLTRRKSERSYFISKDTKYF